MLRHEQLYLASLAAATFLLVTSGNGISPFLVEMSTEFGVPFGVTTHLFSIQAVMWGTVGVFTGRLSDRIGRRPQLIGALVLLAFTRFIVAMAPDFNWVIVGQALAGVAGGAFTSSSMAAAAEAVPPERRGRALGWLISGQSLGLVVGTPLVSLLAAGLGWRGSIATTGVVSLGALVLLLLLMPRERGGRSPHDATVTLRGALDRHVRGLLLAGMMDRLTFAVVAIYLATLMQRSYGIGYTVLAVSLAIVASGNLCGTFFGGRLADRTRDRARFYAFVLVAEAVLVGPLFTWTAAHALTLLLGFLMMATSAIGRPSYLSALSDVPPEVRGGVMGINVLLASFSWLGAAMLGTWIDQYGFWVAAVAAGTMALIGSSSALLVSRRARGR